MTDNGKPMTTLSVADAAPSEASLRNLRSRAADAIRGLQRQAEQRGLDRLTLDEVNEEIQAVRKDRGHDAA